MLQQRLVIPNDAPSILHSIENLIIEFLNSELRRNYLEGSEDLSSEQIGLFNDLGSEISLYGGSFGTTIFYPFGGIDVTCPFSLSPEITDVISFGLNSFGGIDAFKKYLKNPEEGIVLLDEFPSRVEEPGLLKKVEEKYGGLGGIVLNRVLNLASSISGIYFFNVNPDGSLTYPDNCESHSHGAVVEFQTDNNQTKRYWYLQIKLPLNDQDPTKLDEGFQNYFNLLKFNTMLLKGGPPLNGPKHIHEDCIETCLLNPGRKNESFVITDNYGDNGRVSLWPIWEEDAQYVKLDTRAYGRLYNFGSGSHAFLSNGRNLKKI